MDNHFSKDVKKPPRIAQRAYRLCISVGFALFALATPTMIITENPLLSLAIGSMGTVLLIRVTSAYQDRLDSLNDEEDTEEETEE